jgi:hypothetical protein
MGIKETDRKVLEEELRKTNAQIFCISAPNFESRSIASLHWLGSIKARIYHYFVKLNPDSSHRVEALEQVKRYHLERAETMATRGSRNVSIDYPRGNAGRSFEAEMEQAFPVSSEEHILIVDITAMPRRVIVDVLNWLHGRVYRAKKILAVYFVYTWAERYTFPRNPEKIVSLLKTSEVAFSNSSRTSVRKEDYKAVLFTSRYGSEGQSFLSNLPADVSPDILVYFDPTDPQSSFERIRSNFVFLNGYTKRARHYFNISSGNEMLTDLLRNFEPRGEYRLLIAPFGPKPFTVSSWLLSQAIKDKFKKLHGSVDIATLHSQEYNSLYSIGHRHISIFSIDLKSFKNPKTRLIN